MIRPASVADVEAITALERDVFGAGGWSAAQVAADVDAAHRHVVVAELDGRVVGYAAVAIAGEIADVLRIAVLGAFRRTGIASALLDDAERVGAEAGAERVALEVGASNEAAQAFYRHHGYVEIARRRGYYADGDDALVLMRALG
jgi:ribosomal-protein-alanine N-acetyltransferase